MVEENAPFYAGASTITRTEFRTTEAGLAKAYLDDVFVYIYDTPGTYLSAPIGAAENIESATVSWNATLNSQNMTISLSRDGGTTWTTASNGVEYTFTGGEPVGNELRYRVEMNTTDSFYSPFLHSITMSYSTDVSLNYINFTGASTGSRFGYSVASAGDIGGNSISDIIIGAPRNGTGGAVYVFNGTGGAWSYPDSVSASSANYTKSSSTSNELFGWSVAPAYDVTDDGINGVLVGAPGNSTPDANSGAGYVLQRAVVVPPPPAGVTLEKTASVDTIASGEDFSYTIWFNVTDAVDDIWIGDTLASGLFFDGVDWHYTVTSGSLTHSSFSYDSGTRKLLWHFTNVQPGNYSITINVTYIGSNDGRTLVNTANATWTGEPDGIESNAVYVNVIPTFSDMALPVTVSLVLFFLIGGRKGHGKRKKRSKTTGTAHRPHNQGHKQ